MSSSIECWIPWWTLYFHYKMLRSLFFAVCMTNLVSPSLIPPLPQPGHPEQGAQVQGLWKIPKAETPQPLWSLCHSSTPSTEELPDPWILTTSCIRPCIFDPRTKKIVKTVLCVVLLYVSKSTFSAWLFPGTPPVSFFKVSAKSTRGNWDLLDLVKVSTENTIIAHLCFWVAPHVNSLQFILTCLCWHNWKAQFPAISVREHLADSLWLY